MSDPHTTAQSPAPMNETAAPSQRLLDAFWQCVAEMDEPRAARERTRPPDRTLRSWEDDVRAILTDLGPALSLEPKALAGDGLLRVRSYLRDLLAGVRSDLAGVHTERLIPAFACLLTSAPTATEADLGLAAEAFARHPSTSHVLLKGALFARLPEHPRFSPAVAHTLCALDDEMVLHQLSKSAAFLATKGVTDRLFAQGLGRTLVNVLKHGPASDVQRAYDWLARHRPPLFRHVLATLDPGRLAHLDEAAFRSLLHHPDAPVRLNAIAALAARHAAV